MKHFAAHDLRQFSSTLLAKAGMASEMVPTVSDILVMADELGHDTHGLQLLPAYVSALENGGMTASGTYQVASDSGAAAVWDGNYLSGVWLTAQALDDAARRAQAFGVGMIAIRRSHHIACLQAYLTRATDRGLIAFISCSDPNNRAVAPYGGIEPILSPDPIAAGIPAGNDPLLIDMSASITTNGLSARLAASGETLPGPWLQDAQGRATNDPKVLTQEPPGSLLPTGGLDHGHKGTNLALIVECLTQGLSGFGRHDGVDRWTAAVLVQVIDPERFAGTRAFVDQSSHIANACRTSKPQPGMAPVRMPGDRARARLREAVRNGVPLSDAILEKLKQAAADRAISFPVPLDGSIPA